MHTDENSGATPGNEAAPEAGQGEAADFKRQLDEKENKYKYLYAEFENFKRRMTRERADLLKFAWEPVARDLLSVTDNLERAVRHASPQADKALLEGVRMTLRQFHDVLGRNGIQPIEASQKDFNPELHEAVAQAPSNEVPAGKILAEETRGYTLHGRLLRPSRVVVSTGQPES
ncbi:MAG TPA: nucleotide exchange factor GrpE [Bdellovibrionota bacterium]|jgi:molecular chaperone GrpE|nr:nucleotide exchange factor GrpE [Bdellovibrionota bacterium]